MTLPCPDPKWLWWDSFERWCLAGRLPAERPKVLPKSIPQRAFTCFRALHPPKPYNPYAKLGVYERAAFFVNSTAGSPVGGAKEIVAGAKSAGVTTSLFNVGDPNDWSGWKTPGMPCADWARCDTGPRCASLGSGDTANIESPEMNAGFCTPAHALELVGPRGAMITEGIAPHANWRPFVNAMPVWLEIDLNEPSLRAVIEEKGVRELVDYAHSLGIAIPIPAFFCTKNPWWNGDQNTFADYWRRVRVSLWPAPLPFALYAAELVPDWSVIR